MKLFTKFLASVLFSLGLASVALAQTYPTTTPVYIPTAQEAPVTCTAACDVYFSVQGVTTVSVQFTGSPSSFTAALRGSNQNSTIANSSVTWTTLNLTPLNGGATVTSVTAVGTWTASTAALTRVNVHVTAVSGSVTVNLAGTNGGAVSYSAGSVVLTDVEATGSGNGGAAPAKVAVIGGTYNSTPPTVTNTNAVSLQQDAAGRLIVTDPNVEVTGSGNGAAAPSKVAVIGGIYNSTPPTVTNTNAAALQLDADGSLYVNVRDFTVPNDPCQSPGATKSSAIVAITTATTTQLVALSGTKSVYVCGFNATVAAAQTLTFEYGTGSSCGTGTTALTGAFAPATGTPLNIGGGEATAITAPSGNALCVVSTTTGSTQGVLTYVQQ